MVKLKQKKTNNIGQVIDCHTHLVPTVDDGSRSLDESIEMIDQLIHQGVTDIFATPHFVMDENRVSKQKKIKEKFNELKEAIKAEPINIVLGYEIMGSDRLIHIEDYSNYTMGDSNIMMVEANPMTSLAWMDELVYELKLQSMRLMIAHVERYMYFIENPQMLDSLKDQGVLMQINTGSICGKNGKTLMRWTKKLIKENLIDFIGSDCHQMNWRKPEIKKALILLNKWCDKEKLDNIIHDNAKEILLMK